MKEEPMRISITLHVNDLAACLDATLASLLADEALRKDDYELIVCNDGNIYIDELSTKEKRSKKENC